MLLLEEAASLPALRAGLDSAARNRGGPGPDGVSVAAFAAAGDGELAQLRDEILTGAYRPRPARLVLLPKPGGGHRKLAIGCVRDRVVQHALASTLAAALDRELHRFAFAYRRVRSAHDALAAVDRSLAGGMQWVVRGDVEEFFDRISPPLLLAPLEAVTGEPLLVELVGTLLEAGVLAGGSVQDAATGTPQGSPLSPFLSNLYLVPFDRAIEDAGHEMVRYGDDFCVSVASRAQAVEAFATVERALGRLRLTLNREKAAVRHVGEGFTFLGFLIDGSGRRPSDRAARRLKGALDEVLASRPRDGQEELDQILTGWLGYYGSLTGVELPDAVRARAEELESRRVEAATFGHPGRGTSLHARPRTSTSAERPGSSTAPRAATPTSPAVTRSTSRWQRAAAELSRRRAATPRPAATDDDIRASLDLPADVWPSVADALATGDGPSAAERLARIGRYRDASEALEVGPSDVHPAPIPSESLARPLSEPTGPRRGERQGEGPAPAPADTDAAPSPVVVEEADDAPRITTTPADAERLLELFGGAEHIYLRETKIADKVDRSRVSAPPTAGVARAHLVGEHWMGTYPLRANNSVRWAALRIVQSAVSRRGTLAPFPSEVADHAVAIVRSARALSLSPLVSLEPTRGYLVWLLFAEPIFAARARALLSLLCSRAGAPPSVVTRELVPAQDTAKPDKPGTPALWPLGRDPRTGDRAWLLDDELDPILEPCGYLRSFRPDTTARVGAALRAPTVEAATEVANSGPGPLSPTPASPNSPSTAAAGNVPSPPKADGSLDPVSAATSPFRDTPRAQDLYAGCAVLRHFVDKTLAGSGLVSSERYLVTDALGRLGDQAVPALDAVFRHLDDFRPGMGARMIARVYPRPMSCGRIRQHHPELTARVGCDCRFRVPPGAYPTPVLHAVGAAHVPGLEDRVRDAASRGGVARAALAAMNEGRKELGARAAALCARVADLRRQGRLIERQIERLERDLDALLDEVGEASLETPSGTLRRVGEGASRKFVLDL